MSESVRGVGIRFGVQGIAIDVAGVVPAHLLQSLDLTRDGESVQVRNAAGVTVGYVDYDGTKTLNLSTIPSGASIAAAEGNVSALLPAKGTLVTVTDTKGTVIDGGFGGKYRCESSRLGLTNTGVATIDLSLKQHDDADVTAAVT